MFPMREEALTKVHPTLEIDQLVGSGFPLAMKRLHAAFFVPSSVLLDTWQVKY